MQNLLSHSGETDTEFLLFSEASSEFAVFSTKQTHDSLSRETDAGSAEFLLIGHGYCVDTVNAVARLLGCTLVALPR